MASTEKEWKEKLKKVTTELDVGLKERTALTVEERRLEETVSKLEVKVTELAASAAQSEKDARSQLTKAVAEWTEKMAAVESANQRLAEAEARLEADLEAGVRAREELGQQVRQLREAARQDQESIQLLKEAKSCLEAEQRRLEDGLCDKEDRIRELETTVAEGALRIAELGEM